MVVKVNVTCPENNAGAVQVALSVVALGLNVPPTPPSDQVPPVADPPTEPPNAAEIPSWHIAVRGDPALAVGGAFIVIAVLELPVIAGLSLITLIR